MYLVRGNLYKEETDVAFGNLSFLTSQPLRLRPHRSGWSIQKGFLVNFRLAPEDIAYIINHAEDRVLLVGASVWPLLEPLRKALTTVRQLVIIHDVPEAPVPPGVLAYEDLLSLGPPVVD